MNLQKSKLSHLLPITLVVGFLSLSAHADITINIDGPSNVISASGSVNATTDNSGKFAFKPIGGNLDWTGTGLALSSLFSGLGQGGVVAVDARGLVFEAGVIANQELPFSVTGTGASGGYSTLSASNITALESLIGKESTEIEFGTSGDRIIITGTPSVSAIPEVTGSSVLLGLLGLSLVGRRRHC